MCCYLQLLMLPIFLEGSVQALHLESILKDLPLCRFDIDLSYSGAELAHVFERHPCLPGAILFDGQTLVGMVSRQQFLEFLIRPQGIELFLKQPLWVLHSYARRELSIFSGDTPILAAAQQALRRSPHLLGEPIIVQIHQDYYLLDIHELNIAHWQIRGIETQVRYERTQAQMIQSHKMANLGRLVDGVAHEILDPVSFIWGNLSHISSYSQDLLQLLAFYEKMLPAELPLELRQLKERLDLDYLLEDLPKAIDSVKAGAERLSKLATSLQNFCHIDEVYPKPTDLHELLDSILLLLKSRLTSDIQVIKEYGQLPPVVCFPGQLNQVFINILTNCLDRLLNQAVSQQLDLDLKARRNQSGSTSEAKPTIEITTQVCSAAIVDNTATRWVTIRIADNGPGLSQEAQDQLLESFSVKRRSEKETSLAVSYQIVTAKHGGQFKVRSRNASDVEQSYKASHAFNTMHIDPTQPGTEFELLLPLA